jgi:hypothetical protein
MMTFGFPAFVVLVVTVSVVTFISFTISGDPVGTTLGGVMLSDGTRYPDVIIPCPFAKSAVGLVFE